VFDLVAARAAAREADGAEGFDFILGDEKFHMPGMGEISLEAQEILAEGDIARGARMVLGDDDYQRLKAAGATVGDIKILFDELSRISGTGDLGNSDASAPPASTQT
jgi:hypothetical protein